MHTRDQWNARPPARNVVTVSPSERDAFLVHWFGAKLDPDEGPAARLRRAQNYHLDGKEWNDVGYNLAVGLDGSTWEARGWDAVGAHSPGYNGRGYGVIVLAGLGEQMTPEAVSALVGLYDGACARSGRALDVLTHAGTQKPGYTECPGPDLTRIVDGWRKAGRVTAPAAVRVEPAAPAPAPPPAPHVPAYPGHLLRYGSRGGSVTRVQQRLKARGWNLSADGRYGPQTEAVVTAFQREKGLTVDGIVGPATWRALWLAPIT